MILEFSAGIGLGLLIGRKLFRRAKTAITIGKAKNAAAAKRLDILNRIFVDVSAGRLTWDEADRLMREVQETKVK